MAPLSRTPPGDESRTKFVLGPRQVPKNASSRRCELAEREFSERVCEKLDDCWWSMKVTGKYSPGPKPFAKSRGGGYDVQIYTRNRCAFVRVCTNRHHHDVQRESLSNQARKRLYNVLIAARCLPKQFKK
jgi:hypothetical protein